MASPLEYGCCVSPAQHEAIGLRAQCLQFATFGGDQSGIGIVELSERFVQTDDTEIPADRISTREAGQSVVQ